MSPAWWRRGGLLAKMMVRSLIVLSAAILLVEVVAYTTARRQILRLTEERQLDLTSLYAERLDRQIEGIDQDLRIIGELPALREFFYNRQYRLDEEAANHLSGVARYLESLHGRRPAYDFIAVRDADGRELLSLSDGRTRHATAKTKPVPVDASTEGVGQTLRSLAGRRIPRDLSGTVVIDDGLAWSAEINGVALRFRRPVIIDGLFWGDILLHYDLTALVAELARKRLFENGHMVIYARDGTIIHDPQLDPLEALGAHRPVLARRLAEVRNDTSLTIKDIHGTRQLISLTPAQREPWLIAAIVPEREILAGVNRTRNSIIFLVLITLVFEFSFLAIFTRRLIANPAQHLLEGTRRIRDGEYGHAIEVTTRDEFGELAETFNAMSRSLGHTVGELKARGLEVEALNRSLSEKVAELQAEIVQRQRAQQELEEKDEKLRHAEKMEAIGQLAGGIAHEFNNLLAGIMGYAELLRQDLAGQRCLEEHADAILSASKQAATLTTQLLAFSRRGALRTEVLDLNALIREVAKLVERTFDRRIEIKFDFAEEKAMVRGDAVRIQSALLNLAVNARDAMPRGGTLLFGTRRHHFDRSECLRRPGALAPGAHIVLEVSDTGQGIPGDILPHIFEPFFTTKELGKGTGIGLAAVYGTVQSHDGSIEVESKVGEGTVFRLCLPCEGARSSKSTRTSDRPNAAPRGGSGRILLVDDEEMLRQLGQKMLARLGYEVCLAANGLEALEIYRREGNAIDLVLLDMLMPGMDGRDTLRALRELDAELRVVICSGFSTLDESWNVPDLAIDGLLHKPFQLRELAETISQAFAAARSTP